MFRQEPIPQLNSARSGRGFSLIELSVVMMVIAIIAAFVVPQALAYLRMYRLGVGGRNVATALQRARFLATSNNTKAGILAPNFQLINIEQYDSGGKLEPQLKGLVELP